MPADRPVSEREMEGRNRKAAALADVIQAHRGTAEAARSLPPLGWSIAAQLAGVRPPSDMTVAVVLALLDHRERYPHDAEAVERQHGLGRFPKEVL